MKTTLRTTALLLITLSHLDAYELHEWGTFTTVSGSDGVILSGLEREEEALPAYVRHHPGFNNHQPGIAGQRMGFKKMPVPVRNVKVKMETPVIYFHSDEGFSATVKVGFNGGTISQWYPQRSGGEVIKAFDPLLAAGSRYLDFSEEYRGSIEWKIDVLSPEESREAVLFKPDDLLQWTHGRIPEANAVRNEAGETEGYLFYRGLGSFDPGLKTSVSFDETLQLDNQSGGQVPYILVYERLADGTLRWSEPGGLEAGSSTEVAQSELKERKAGFDVELYKTLVKNLAAQGLLRSEAEAMVKTWWKSYFETPGLRVFWVLPDSKTDSILPLEVEPAPSKTVRVLVGRSEVIRPSQERIWLAQATSSDEEQSAKWAMLQYSDRFGLAYAQRIASLQEQVKR